MSKTKQWLSHYLVTLQTKKGQQHTNFSEKLFFEQTLHFLSVRIDLVKMIGKRTLFYNYYTLQDVRKKICLQLRPTIPFEINSILWYNKIRQTQFYINQFEHKNELYLRHFL